MPEDPSKRYQFLFVDDDPTFLATVTAMLKQLSKANWAFRTANNHSQALEHLKAQPVDVVVLDIEMPVMDGIEFLRLLQKTHPGLKVVMLSARLDEGARKTSMELGAACTWRSRPPPKDSTPCSLPWMRWPPLERSQAAAG